MGEPIPDGAAIRRALIIAALLGVTALGLCLVPRPPLDNSIDAMLVDDSPRAAAYGQFKARFGADEVVIVQATGPDGEAIARAAVAFEQALADDPAVEQTLGPATAYADTFDVLLDPDIGGFGELPRLAPRFDGPLGAALGLMRLDDDGGRARIYAFLRPGRPEQRAPVAARLDGFRQTIEAAGGEVHIAGPPILNLALNDASHQVERTALPLLVAVCVLIMGGLTRSLRQTIAALAPVGLGVGATMGLLSLTGHSTDIVINIAQPLLFVVLLASGLHVVVAWQDARRRGLDRHAAPWVAAREKARACTLALGTTALGFASLGWSDMPAIRAFGVVSAVGLTIGLPLVLWVLPALLQLFGGAPRPLGGAGLGRLAAGCVEHAVKTRWLWPALAVAVTVFGLWATTALPVSTGGVHYFDADARVRQDYEALRADGVGLSTVEAVLDFGDPPDEATVATLRAFADAAEALPGVRRAVGLPLFLREAHWRLTGQDDLPDASVLAEMLGADGGPGGQHRAAFADGGGMRLSLLIDHLDAPALDGLYAALSAEADRLAPGARLSLTGHHELVVQAQASLVDTLLWSLLTTALLIELIILVALRSVALALAALLPMIAPVSLNFGLMWALDIPLDLGTCMTGAIALGIAVDDALHFMIAWRKASPGDCARTTGRALILTSVVIAAGFLALLTADFAPTARFGLLCALAMASALLADLLVLPPLLQRLAPWAGEAGERSTAEVA